MSKEPLKVGDKIRVYGSDRYSASATITRIIQKIDSNEIIITSAGECVHPKQCRRLIKKERKQWRGGWNFAGNTHPRNIVFIPDGVVPTKAVSESELLIGVTLVEKRKPK